MTITYVKGDLLKALENGDIDYMLHQTNAMGIMGSGIAKQVKEQVPKAYQSYIRNFWSMGPEKLLGTNSSGGGVINMTAQRNYGNNNKRYTNYGALANCLSDVWYQVNHRDGSDYISDYKIKIGLPYKMSSDRGGADWTIVLELIEYLLDWADVYIYHLEDLK